MKEKMELLIHLIVSFVRLFKPGGMKAVIAETMIMKQQFIVMNRGRGRVPKLGTSDRFLLGLLAEDEEDLQLRLNNRELPSSPPTLETIDAKQRFTFSSKIKVGEIEQKKKFTVPHHAAHFGLTRWTLGRRCPLLRSTKMTTRSPN